MYNLIINLVNDEYKLNLKQNETYNQFFETNFINTFQTVTSEELSDFNKHLLDTQINYVRDFLLKDKHIIQDTITNQSYNLQSTERKIHLTQSSRHSYRINSPSQESRDVVFDKVIIPIEDSSLFSTYRLGLYINSTLLEIYLRGTIQVRNRIYGIYTELSNESSNETTIALSDSPVTVQFTNLVTNEPIQGDVYKLTSSKPNKLILEADKNEFMEGDYLRICNLDTIELSDESCLHKQYKVISIQKQDDTHIELKINNNKNPILNGLYVMNMSLQHTIHLTQS
tara:strand:- start:362 stop:1213 length:852 start_codon:yes stop_codon:yes gene_type:complete